MITEDNMVTDYMSLLKQICNMKNYTVLDYNGYYIERFEEMYNIVDKKTKESTLLIDPESVLDYIILGEEDETRN